MQGEEDKKTPERLDNGKDQLEKKERPSLHQVLGGGAEQATHADTWKLRLAPPVAPHTQKDRERKGKPFSSALLKKL